MKKTYLILAIILLTPATIIAGIRTPVVVEKCYIGKIEPSYIVSEKRIAFDAVIYIRDSNNKPVSGAEIHGAWRDKKEIITDGKCTTGDTGKCSIPHVINAGFGETITLLPQRGIRILSVECPDMKYTYKDNSTFAWATLKD